MDMARENHVPIVSLPPHLTYKMQLFDRRFVAPLKCYYSQEIETWAKNNSGRVVKNNHVSQLFGKAYNRIVIMLTSKYEKDEKLA